MPGQSSSLQGRRSQHELEAYCRPNLGDILDTRFVEIEFSSARKNLETRPNRDLLTSLLAIHTGHLAIRWTGTSGITGPRLGLV